MTAANAHLPESVSTRDEGPGPTRPAARQPEPRRWGRFRGVLRRPTPGRHRRVRDGRGPWTGPLPAAA